MSGVGGNGDQSMLAKEKHNYFGAFFVNFTIKKKERKITQNSN